MNPLLPALLSTVSCAAEISQLVARQLDTIRFGTACFSALFSAIWFSRMWYSLPLVVVISLVYAATRHEEMRPILEHALRFGLWVVAFMFIVFVVLTVLTMML